MLAPLSSFIHDNCGGIGFPLQGLIVRFYYFEKENGVFFKSKTCFKVKKTCCFLRQVFSCIYGDPLDISGWAGK